MFRSFQLKEIFSLFVVSASSKSNKRTSFQRSEEVGVAADMRNRMIRQSSKDSTDGSVGSLSGDLNT